MAADPTPSASATYQAACIPVDEAERLAALRRLDLLNTPASESFDRVTRLVSQVLDVPMALVSLVDDRRQWFKSRVGLNATETPRDVSFCGHAVFNRAPLVVPDAAQDARFAGNPLVTGAPHIRAYLGIPLFTRAGFPIGTLCALDTRPRHFDEADLRNVTDCAQILEVAIQAEERRRESAEVLQFAREREALFRDTFEQAAVGMTHTSFSGQLLRVNQRLCQMLGYTSDELHAISFLDITHPDDIAKNVELLQQMMDGKLESYHLEKRFRRNTGDYLWTGVSVALKRSSSGSPDYMMAVIEDIHARRQAECELVTMQESLRSQIEEQTARLEEANAALRIQVKKALASEHEVRETAHRFRAIANHIPALIGYWNKDLRCEFANELHRPWFGIEPQRIIGMRMDELMGPDRYEKVEPHVRVALESHAQHFEDCTVLPDGRDAIWDVRFVPDVAGDGTVSGIYVLITDTTQARNAQKALEAANAKLVNDSVTDFLTSLSNRRVFSERSEEAAARYRDHGEPYGLILLDLDNFKQINDVHGHATGDDVLRAVGRLLKAQLRSHRDVAARLGGEEFAVLCFGDLDEDLLRLVAERIRAQIHRESLPGNDRRFQFTASFGLALSSPLDHDWKTIYARADAALYVAKAGGKDRVDFGHAPAVAAPGRRTQAARSH